MTDVYLVYVTAANQDEARRLGRSCVEARLAACANLVPGIESFYHWDGELQTSTECLVLLKTVQSKVSALTQRLREMHSYTCPAIVALPIESGFPDFLDWVRAEVS
jgi:periplasmic divalent cation tolerance protein